jgi:hypothetical protein
MVDRLVILWLSTRPPSIIDPMPTQTASDDRHFLKLLSIFHYVVAAIGALCSLFPIVHLIVGAVFIGGDMNEPNEMPPSFVGWILVAVAMTLIFVGMTLSACIALAGRCLQTHRGYTFCLVMAAIECLFMPLGTVLGVLTIVVLMRPSVKAMFGYAIDNPTEPPKGLQVPESWSGSV